MSPALTPAAANDIILLSPRYAQPGPGKEEDVLYETISDQEFRKRLKNRFEGLPKTYFFYGDEDYLKRSALEDTLKTLSGGDPMDSATIDQTSFSPGALEDALFSPPMFSALKPVAVSLSLTDLKPSEVAALCSVLSENGPDSFSAAILSIPSEGFDPGLPKKPSAVFKKLAAAAVPVLFERVSGARLNGWAGRHYNGNGVVAPAAVCAFTVSWCGQDMFRLASEIDKISWYVRASGRHEVTEDDIRAAGCQSDEFDSFALANAILSRDCPLALEILDYLRGNRTEPARIMSEIIRVLCDMTEVSVRRDAGMSPEQISRETGIKPYPLGRYLTALRQIPDGALSRALDLAAEADAGVKGYSKDYIPIERFICAL